MLKKNNISIFGTGAVATALALALHKRKYSIVVIGRNRSKTNILAKKVKAKAIVLDGVTINDLTEIVFIAVTDSAISAIVQTLQNKFRSLKNSVFFHLSGGLTSDVLKPLHALGASIGSFHPMQTFPLTNITGKEFQGIWMAVEGDGRAVQVAKKITQEIGANSFHISPNNKVLYHAAGIFASNYIVTLLSVMEQIARSAKLPKKNIFKIFSPIIYQTIKNVLISTPEQALTGPIARGDIKTITKHLRALSCKDLQHLMPLYSALGIETARLAKKKHAR